jgi:hypothetical protein
MARELGWDAAETARQVAEYRELVGRSEAGKAASAGEPALDRQDTHS